MTKDTQREKKDKPICPKCNKPMKLDKKNSSKYNKSYECCGLGLFIG